MRAVLFVTVLVAACADSSDTTPRDHEFPRVQVQPGQETDKICQSWTLDNDEAIYVNAISMTNQGGFHHSNWFFVPDGTYKGPDGTWNCDDRNYDQSTSAVIGGVAFAQSTQATEETLGFAPNAAYMIPPHSTIVGQLHLLNVGDEVLETGISFSLKPIAESDVDILLSPAAFTYQLLQIPPMAKSRFQTDCDLEKAYGAPPEFSLYYMLPHYHALGTGMSAIVNMPDGPMNIFGTEGHIGDVKSKKLDPPFSLHGSSHLKFSCDFNNPRSDTVTWGNATGEMCILVAWTDSPHIIVGGVYSGVPGASNTYVGNVDGVEVYEAQCGVSFLPLKH